MPDHMHDEERITRELQRKRLTFVQRRKHLDRLDRAIAAKRDDLDFPRQRERVEFGVLAAVAAVLLFGFVIWTAVLDDGGSSDSAGDMEDVGAVLMPASSPTMLAEAPPVVTPGYDRASDTCYVSPTAVNVAPSLPRSDTRYLRWYGNRDVGLWVAPLDYGATLPTGWPKASSLWFAGAETPVSWYGAQSAVVVNLKRLDGYTVMSPVVGMPGHGDIQDVTLTIPSPGCWQLTGTAGNKELSIVVDVLPFEQRPDIAMAESYYAARPYDVPNTCPITARSGPEQRGTGHHWLQSGDLRAEFNDLLFAGQEQTVGIRGADVTDGLVVTARKLNNDGGQTEMGLTPLWNSDARLAIFSIPSDGCWELELETPTQTVTFVIYVYPAGCEPELRDGEFVADCEPPRE